MTTLEAIGPDIARAARAFDPDTVELRRAIHADPEIGLDLPDTQAKITEALTGLGLDITLGRDTTSVVADLDMGKPGPTVLLRGDMDALPLQEDNAVDYKSRHDGRMHACGHDAHVSMLVSAAKLLAGNKGDLTGRVRFMFQPGEEGYGGAEYMIREGVLDGVDRAFAIHVFTNLPDGMIVTRGGAIMASADKFEITIDGRGGHASAPHHALDPIPAAASTITSLHTMVGRSIDATLSGLVTVAHVEAGTTNNVIPPSAYMEGTIRAHDEHTRATLKSNVDRVAQGTAAAHGCTCSTHIEPGYPVTINDTEQAGLVGQVTNALLGEGRYAEMPRPVMGAEDFSYVLQHVPGAMAFLGVCPEGDDYHTTAPNHSNLMRISEKALGDGVALYAAMAMAR
ncbi:MAG: amidohydrolase [Actinomycetia bacterium]|nr:amidohydrolase [Actinomycetes bacterium]MCP4958697.1 amidohydrolase [Actinomycetes bacterium]